MLVDDTPDADEAIIRAHREELLAIAAELGITDLKYASGNRLVGTPRPNDPNSSTYIFRTKARLALGYRIRLYADYIAADPRTGEDLRQATPL